ncbi:MAG: hypothetical protein LBK66_05830 [Spirochaetaceae bacterium]|jgi:hypothetical protein|nr:hypothetical protein [Spirochaetaceae bacterium]
MITGYQKVIVVDDVFKEVEPLLSALWRKGISCIYLTGQQEYLPERPFSGVRLLFLDIELDTKALSDKDKASTLAAVVKKIIGENPCPYFIVFWTKHDDNVIKEVLRYLGTGHISPVGWMNFDKPTSSDSIVEVTELIKKIESKSVEMKAFNYLLAWENLLDKTISDFSNKYFSAVSTDGNTDDWSGKMAVLLGHLASSYTGEKLYNNTDDLKNAMLAMSDSLGASIQKNVKAENLDLEMRLLQQPIELQELAVQNSLLFLDFQPGKKVSFGNIFITNQPDEHLKEALYKNIYPDNTDGTLICGMIVTPSCDIAHSKYLHNQKNCYRILYGLMIPVTDRDQIKKIHKIKKDSIFMIEPFWYEQKELIFILLFHFGSLSSVWWDDNDVPQFEFAIKEHLAFDVQSKLANHVNRLGNSMLQFQ